MKTTVLTALVLAGTLLSVGLRAQMHGGIPHSSSPPRSPGSFGTGGSGSAPWQV